MKYLGTLLALHILASPLQAEVNRQTITVEGNYVTLGDIFPTVAKKLAKTEVLIAPAPGATTTLNQQWLTTIAQKYGIDYIPQGHHDTIKVKAASETVPMEEVEKILKEHLTQIIKNNSFTVKLDNKDLALHFPKGKTGEILITNADVNSQQTRFQATLVIQEANQELNRVKVAGRIQTMTAIPVLNRAIHKGETIQPEDIEWQELPTNQVNQATIMEESGLIGASTKRQELPANRPISKHEITFPLMVVKNQAVTIFAESPIMSITAKGKALENGPKDAYVKIMNIDSQKVIHATVIGPQQVRVDIPSIHTIAAKD